MGNKEITGSESLLLHISQLKAERTSHEEELTQSFNELTQLIFNPTIAKKEEPSEEQNGRRDLINLSKIVLNMGTNYIIEQNFGKRQKFCDFLTDVLIEVITIPLINSSVSKLLSGIDKQLFGKTEST
jgi:hypothetical protein